jgi:hypothetical protein
MQGYRQSSFDPDAGAPTNKTKKGVWWKALLATLAYGVPLVWLWIQTDFPDSLGVQISAHGKAGVIESWYYSYLLLERHRPLDIITFFYMWTPVVWFIAWLTFKPLRKALRQLRKSKFSLYADQD